MDKMHPVGTVPTNKMHSVGTVPTDKMHPVGTQIFSSYIIFSLNLDCIAKINDRSWHLFFDLSLLSLISLLLPTLMALPLPTSPFSTLPLPTPPNPSLNYHNESNCIIQDQNRSPASTNHSSYYFLLVCS